MHHTFGSYCAHVVEVSVAPGSNGQKRVTIHKVVSVGDVGQPVNLSMLEAQMQGGIIDGLGAAFYGEVPIDKGRATSRNFGDYRMIRMREAPLAIEAHFIPSRLRPTGFGEPPLPPIAPAVANAIAALTGERIRDDAVHQSRLRARLITDVDHGDTETRSNSSNASAAKQHWFQECAP